MVFLVYIVTINNFASIMHNKIFIVFKLSVIEFTSVLAPNLRGKPLFLKFNRKVPQTLTFFVSYTYLKLLIIFEIQMIDYFRGQPCRSLMGTEIGVLIDGINKNHHCKHFPFHYA